MPEIRDGLGFMPGWKVAQVLNDYFAGEEAVHPMATDEEFARSITELVGNVVETSEIACRPPMKRGPSPLRCRVSAKEAAPARSAPLERAPPI